MTMSYCVVFRSVFSHTFFFTLFSSPKHSFHGLLFLRIDPFSESMPLFGWLLCTRHTQTFFLLFLESCLYGLHKKYSHCSAIVSCCPFFFLTSCLFWTVLLASPYSLSLSKANFFSYFSTSWCSSSYLPFPHLKK